MTDIDLLHKVFVGQLTGRRCGKTFLQCHLFAGIIETTNFDTIICILKNYNNMRYLLPMIKQVFKEHELELVQLERHTFTCNEKLIKFISYENLKWGSQYKYEHSDIYYKIYMG